MDYKKFSQIVGIEYLSIALFGILTSILTFFLSKYLPSIPLDQNMIPNMSPLELQIITGEYQSFILVYFLLFAALLIGGFAIYNISRKLIYEKLINDKYSLKGFWKYSLFNTTISLSFFGIATIIYYIWTFLTNQLTYLLSFIPDLLRDLIFIVLFIIILFYSMIIYTYLANNYFFKENKGFKSLIKLREINIKKYFLTAIIAFIGIYLFNYIIYFLPKIMLYIFGLLVFSTHNAGLKYYVTSKENYKKDEKKKIRRVKKS